jgi:hypothetical protein
VVLWNTKNLGYLTVLAGSQLAAGTLRPDASSIDAGRLGALNIKDHEIVLGTPLLINKSNIDTFDF